MGALRGGVKRILVVDLDVHQGDGVDDDDLARTEPLWYVHKRKGKGKRVLPREDQGHVFLLSLHQQNNFPPLKMQSHLDVPLEDEMRDEEYLKRVVSALSPSR